MDSFNDLCTPAKVYVVLTAFTLIVAIFARQYSYATIKLIFAVVYTFFLNWLCVNKLPGISWFLVLIPFIGIGLIFIFYILDVGELSVKSLVNTVQQQQQQQSSTPTKYQDPQQYQQYQQSY
jgi:uncharacterized membrane protein